MQYINLDDKRWEVIKLSFEVLIEAGQKRE